MSKIKLTYRKLSKKEIQALIKWGNFALEGTGFSVDLKRLRQREET